MIIEGKREDEIRFSVEVWWWGSRVRTSNCCKSILHDSLDSCTKYKSTFLRIVRFVHAYVEWKVYQSWGFPGGAVVENLPANAGDTGSSPGLGRSHMPWSNWAREPQLLSLRFWSLCSTTREAAMVRGPCTTMKSGPCSLQLEQSLAQKRRPNTAKYK